MLFSMCPSGQCWLSANDISREGYWTWDDTKQVFFIGNCYRGYRFVSGFYESWHRSGSRLTEPNDSNGEDCGHIWRGTRRGSSGKTIRELCGVLESAEEGMPDSGRAAVDHVS